MFKIITTLQNQTPSCPADDNPQLQAPMAPPAVSETRSQPSDRSRPFSTEDVP